MGQPDQRISEAVDREYAGLRSFIRKRVDDPGEAEDILQDVFYELVEAYRMMKPIEQVTAWLFRVARNRIIDLFRRKKREAVRQQSAGVADHSDSLTLEELLPSPDAGPEGVYMRKVLAEELDAALDELPEEQREAFVAHEIMGYSFQEISARSGESVNTLLSRKHYAVLHLRKRLQAIYDEFMKT
ncbi:MAG: sigma-70 family RNA polymerase sigma factor [Acidobacteria bacterium]|nr:sigma-70 family RNA polymerase sigma factor [Acidobacteriota bacterium]